MSDPLIWQLLLQAALIGLNAIFACAEIAVLSVKEAKLSQLDEQGNKKAKKLLKLVKNPAKFLATIQVAITLSGFLGSAFAAENFAERLTGWVISNGLNVDAGTFDSISVIVITLVLSYFTLVFGELVPKRLAMKNSEKVSLAMSGILSFVAKVFAPIVWLLTVSTNGILRLFGIDPNENDEDISEEEILLMVDAGSKTGAIDEAESEMIQNVFEFDNIPISDFTVHRTNVVMLETDASDAEWEEVINSSKYRFYPVYGESVDDIVGVLDTSEYFRLKDKSRENVMINAVKPAFFVPENLRADILLKKMKSTANRIAIVLDEYGGMLGIVTRNDLVEQIVGDLGEEDPEKIEDVMKKLDDGSWSIPGVTPLDEVAEEIGVDLPINEYDTFGGFVLATYGSIPDDGTTFEIDIASLHIDVVSICDHIIEEMIVSIIPEDEKDDKEEKETASMQ